MQQKKQWQKFFTHFLIIFLPLGMIFSAFLYYIYTTEKNADFKLLATDSRSQVNRNFTAIAKDYTSISSDLMMISKMHEMKKIFDGNNKDIHDLESDLLSLSSIKKMYDQVRYLDESGSEILRINYNRGSPELVPAENLQNKAQRYYFEDTFSLNEGEIFVSPLDLNIENGKIETPLKPMVRIGTPVFSSTGEKRGVLLLNFFGNIIINKLQGFGGENASQFSFLNSRGYWLKGPDAEDEWGFMYDEKQDRTFGNKYPEAWKTINTYEYGQFKNQNGLFTYKTLYPLSEYHNSSSGTPQPYGSSSAKVEQDQYYFKIVSHVPASVIQQRTQNISNNLLRLYALLMILSFTISWITAHYSELKYRMEIQSKKLIQDLQKAVEEVETLQDILPICSYCKNIRNDDGYYEKLEGYFHKNSGVDFSHTICPECLKNQYPDIYEGMVADKKI